MKAMELLTLGYELTHSNFEEGQTVRVESKVRCWDYISENGSEVGFFVYWYSKKDDSWAEGWNFNTVQAMPWDYKQKVLGL